MVLLVVDTQQLLVNEQLYNVKIFIKNIKKLISKARESGNEVIYVVHDDGVDSDLTQGKEGFQVYKECKQFLSGNRPIGIPEK